MECFLVAVLIAACCILSSGFANRGSASGEYPDGSLRCKLYAITELDCSMRNITTIPSLPAHITSINLSRNKLTNISQSTFNGQAILTVINMKFNQLETIRGSPFLTLGNLTDLDLCFTKLETLGEASFYGLYELERLLLCSNELRYLPRKIFIALSNLQVLNLRSNYLTDIPSEELSPLQSLIELDLTFNYFSSYSFGKGFQNLTNLSILRVYSLNLTEERKSEQSLDHVQENIVVLDNDTFANCVNSPIKSLYFIYDLFPNVTVIPDENLFHPLKNLTNLQTHCEFINAIPSAGSNLEYLKIYLDIDDLRLKLGSLDFALETAASIRHLDLSYSFINGIYGPAFVNFTDLRILELNGVIYSMQEISDDAFHGLYNLEELYLSYNQINKLPVEAFKSFESGKLKLLDLSYNSLTGYFPDKYSFSAVSSLTHLNLSCNPIADILGWIDVLTNLQELKLNSLTVGLYINFDMRPLPSVQRLEMSYPNFKDLIQFTGAPISQYTPQLHMLNLSGMNIYTLTFIRDLRNLKTLIASESFVVLDNFEILWGKLISFPYLEVLNLASNRIATIDDMEFNKTIPNIVYLDLSNNDIHSFSKDSLFGLKSLRGLNLTKNVIFSLHTYTNGLTFLPDIEYLDISRNLLTEIPEAFLEGLNTTLKLLLAGGNPFSCTCAIEPFREWILSDSKVVLLPDYSYKCKSPAHLSGLCITQIDLDCESHFVLYVIIGVISGLSALFLIIILTKYRWHIQYRLFLVCSWRRKYQPIENEEHNTTADANLNIIRYDAFVSYAHENERDLTWVIGDLRKNIEEGTEPFRLCIGHARDFIPGTPLLEAISAAIHNSRKTIIVLSPSYLESEMCYFETQHAWLRLLNEGKDVIILVLLDPIPDAKMTMWLRQFLCKKGYLRWPPSRSGQKLFFRCLRKMMKTRTVVNRRYDV